MLLTSKKLHNLETKSKGFSKNTVEGLGVKWPPPKGWLWDLVGTQIDKLVYMRIYVEKDLTEKEIKRLKKAT